MFELTRIAAMAGHGGLFSVHTALKNGIVLESLDDNKTKIVTRASSKVSILSEISIYTTTSDGSVSLESVLKALYIKHKGTTTITSKSDGSQLKQFLLEVLPNTDFDRVYVSDIKKLANWYNLLIQYAPEVLKSEEPTGEAPEKKSKESKRPVSEKSELEEAQATTKKTPTRKKPSKE